MNKNALHRIMDDEPVFIVTGRHARTRRVGDATLIASAAPEHPTVVSYLRFDEHGNLVMRHVRRIRQVAE